MGLCEIANDIRKDAWLFTRIKSNKESAVDLKQGRMAIELLLMIVPLVD